MIKFEEGQIYIYCNRGNSEGIFIIIDVDHKNEEHTTIWAGDTKEIMTFNGIAPYKEDILISRNEWGNWYYAKEISILTKAYEEVKE